MECPGYDQKPKPVDRAGRSSSTPSSETKRGVGVNFSVPYSTNCWYLLTQERTNRDEIWRDLNLVISSARCFALAAMVRNHVQAPNELNMNF
jgi:hypothetical protein